MNLYMDSYIILTGFQRKNPSLSVVIFGPARSFKSYLCIMSKIH